MSGNVLTIESEAIAPSHRSALRKLFKDPQAVITGTILLVIIVLGICAPLLTLHGPNNASLDAINADVGARGYLLGGDQSGRDIYARLMYSINTSMISAVIGTSVALLVGVTFGLVGGYFGQRIRGVTEWVFSLVMTFPGLLLLIVLLPVTHGDYKVTMVIFGVLLSPSIYRIVRNLVVGVKEELFVDAARVSGLSHLRILGRHVLFVVRGPIIIAAAFLAGTSIGVQAMLAFLGVGSATIPSFGAMISYGFGNLYAQPLQFIWPSLFLGVITASFVLLGNSIRDALEASKVKPVKIALPARQRQVSDLSASGRAQKLLVVEGLAVAYPTPTGHLKEVVSDVSFSLDAGETLGVVGESGSGKTQSAFAILGVLPNEAAVTRGSIRFEGRELLDMAEHELASMRGNSIAYVPQEPMTNLDPSFTIGAQLGEGIRVVSRSSRKAAHARALELLDRVGISDPQRTFDSYPHQISGGMAQRVLIAGAIAGRPKILVADEPTTALDVTVQADILDLLRELQEEFHMGLLLVTHNFGVVADICQRVAVMQQGRIVETGETNELFRNPKHEYTRGLLDALLDENVVRSDDPPVCPVLQEDA